MTGHDVCPGCGGCRTPVVTYGCLKYPQCTCGKD